MDLDANTASVMLEVPKILEEDYRYAIKMMARAAVNQE